MKQLITQARDQIRKQAHWCRFQLAQQKAAWHLRALRKKKVARVVFLVTDHRIWHAQSVYDAMQEDPRFDPVMVAYPGQPGYSEGLSQLERAKETYRSFSIEGASIEQGWCVRNGQTKIRPPTEFGADILFYSSPYRSGNKYLDRVAWCKHLCCYIPYCLSVSRNYERQYNGVFHNAMWRIYCSDELQRRGFETHGQIGGKNAVVTGYPPFDLLHRPLDETQLPYNDNGRIRLIWAPHHTISPDNSSLPPSHFLDTADDMIAIANQRAEQIFWVFRPHPALKLKLYNTPSWGKERTDRYYSYWRNSSHSALSEGEHIMLFQWSDAMIHDSGTFLVEYSHTGKPTLYLRRRQEIEPFLSDLAKKALEYCEFADKKEKISEFLSNLLKKPPTKTIDQASKHKEIRSAADSILLDLKISIWGNKKNSNP